MKPVTVILAAHGGGDDSRANATVRRQARDLAGRGRFDAVLAAFNQGAPAFRDVPGHVRTDDVIVAPLMTSEGYFCARFLPRELERHPRSARLRFHYTPPVGVHPRMGELLHQRAVTLACHFKMDPRRTAVALIGHGTPRHDRSCQATIDHAHALKTRGDFADATFAFLDEAPHAQDLLDMVTSPHVIVIPFLTGGAFHALRDLPRRLGFSSILLETPDDGELSFPLVETLRGKRVVCDDALGARPELLDLIDDLATSALNALRTNMTPSPRRSVKRRLGTRGSALALWQARHVAAKLEEQGMDVDLIEMRTSGDRDLASPIAELASDSPFTDDIDRALLTHDIDLAAHSLKDLSTTLPDGLTIAAVLPRGSAGESLVSRGGLRLMQLPPGARVGTSSPRRRAQLLALRPDLRPVPLRGAVDDRVAQVHAGRFDAAILATAGLERLDLLDQAAETFPLADFLPAPGQGALAVVTRADDPATSRVVRRLNHAPTRRAVETELGFLRAFEQDPSWEVAAHASTSIAPDGAIEVELHARLLEPEGRSAWSGRFQGRSVEDVVRRAVDQARTYLRDARSSPSS